MPKHAIRDAKGHFIPAAKLNAPEPPPAPVIEPAPPPPPPPLVEPPIAKVLPFRPTPTLGDVLGVISGPAPTVPSESPLLPFPSAPGPELPPPPAAPPGPSEDALTFASFASQAITSVGVSVVGGIIRRRGKEPAEPDDDVIDKVNDVQSRMLAEHIGDKAIPPWMVLCTAWGQLGMTMWMGAKPIEGATPTETGDAREEPPPEPPVVRPATGGRIYGAPPPLR